MRALACAFLLVAGTALAQPPSVETLFDQPRFARMTLAPDGSAIAALAPVAGRQNLVLLDVKTKKPTPITAFTTRDIVEVNWVNSKRLVLRTGSLGKRDSDARGGALYAIDRDGGESRMLSEGGSDEQSSAGARLVGRALVLVRTLPGESDDIIAQERVFTADGSTTGDIFRVNTRTGRRTSIGFGKPDAGEGESWVVDDKGVARAQAVFSKGRVRIHYRAGPDATWQKLDEFSQTSAGWYPLAMADDDKTLLVSDSRSRDKAAIVRYDPANRSFGEVLAEHPQVDLRELATRQGRAFGVRFEADRGGTAWFDEGLARLQSSLDRALPNASNYISWSDDRSLVLVFSHSDVSPGSYYLMDTKAGKMEWLVDRSPQIKSRDLLPMRPVRYAARDGLQIPAYLTLPKGADKNLPLVVVVHGGPWVDGDGWGFNPEVQFLATRGYAVLQPNFRGTTRYGWKHYSSSFGQWGLAMQDDVTDGVKWAVDQGIADPKRVCIYGASYGGYATMMGLAKTPELYRCGINYVGVTDVNLFLTATWADYAQSDFIKYSVKEMVGDTSKDSERLKATSPVELAARIKAPVLMAYGAADDRVPIAHGQRMRSALERNGATPVWMVADGEGHGFREMKNQKMFYEAMEKFLAEHLGK
ncbi:MAG: S9 family peptidase [Pseudomonadota bacterium]|nr:S9 family peptidase [Pseudomonadota bacterium]